MCCALCPEVFELTSKGYARAIGSEVPARFRDAVREAVDQCPEHAISIAE
jgi:ferredoxin